MDSNEMDTSFSSDVQELPVHFQREVMYIDKIRRIRQEISELKLHARKLKEAGLRLESYVKTVADLNHTIKNKGGVGPYVGQICGFDEDSHLPDWQPVEDLMDVAGRPICQGPHKCPTHERWELLRVGELETYLILTVQKIDKLKEEMALCKTEMERIELGWADRLEYIAKKEISKDIPLSEPIQVVV